MLTIDHEEDQNVLELLRFYLDHQKQYELHKQFEVLDHLSIQKKDIFFKINLWLKQTCDAVILIVSIVDFDRHEVPFAAKRAVWVKVDEWVKNSWIAVWNNSCRFGSSKRNFIYIL